MLLLLLAVAGSIAVVVVFAGQGDMSVGVMSAIFFAVTSVAVSAMWLRMGRGLVEITDELLELRIPSAEKSYRWRDVIRARLLTVSQLGIYERLLARLGRGDRDQILVEIGLRRSVPSPLLPWQKADPDAFGLPSFSSKEFRVYVADPEGLVNAVNAKVP
ncbi:MAG: hypothetical protein IIB22_09490 [Chloroflexi bacterium]|nr:hypothetical protein [Chloroflexota bacterium]